MRHAIGRLAIAFAVLVCAAVPMPAALAGPGEHEGCSGTLCAQLSGGRAAGYPAAGSVEISFDVAFPSHTMAAGAVLTAHNDAGMTPDLASARGSLNGGVAPVVTLSGNDLVFTIPNDQYGGFEVRYYATVDPAAGGQLAAWASLDFADDTGDAPATSTSADVLVSAGPDVELSQLYTAVQPNLSSDDIGYQTNRLPHGYSGVAIAAFENHSVRDLAAGAPLRVTLPPGMAVDPLDVRYGANQNEDSNPTTHLRCTGAAPTWTCALPTVPAGAIGELWVRIDVDASAPVGSGGTASLTVPPAAIADVAPGDNSTSEDVVVGPVSRVALSADVNPEPVVVGQPATLTFTVRNDGPDPARYLDVDISIQSPGVTVDDTGGGRLNRPYEVVFDNPAPVPVGGSATYQVRFTPHQLDDQATIVIGLGAAPTVDFIPCADSSGAPCAGLTHELSVVTQFVRALGEPAPGGPPLAETGPDVAPLVTLGAALTALGFLLLVAARRCA